MLLKHDLINKPRYNAVDGGICEDISNQWT